MPSKKNLKPVSRSYPSVFYKRVVGSFISIALLLIVLILYFSIISVKILITSKVYEEKLDTLVEVISIDTSPVPDKVRGKFFEVIMEETAQKNATGKTIEKQKLRTTMTLFNESGSAQPLVRTTRLLSPEQLLFRTDQSVTVPAHGQALVPVYVDENSDEYSSADTTVVVQTKFSIPGLSEERQRTVYARNEEEIDFRPKELTVVSEQDIDSAKSELEDRLIKKILSEQHVSSVQTVLTKTEVQAFSSDKKVGEISNTFATTLKLHAWGAIVDQEEFLKHGSALLAKSLPKTREVTRIDEKSLQVESEKFDPVTHTITLRLQIAGVSKVRLDDTLFDKSQLVGMNKKDLIDFYAKYDDLERVVIRFFPFWIHRVPQQLDHIDVIIQQD